MNLEHLINEEDWINNISEYIFTKEDVKSICTEWWNITENSSVKEMQVFFEEDASRKLIKVHQILLWIFIGFIEIHAESHYTNLKSWNNMKNMIKYLHRSYLVFIQFINGNLSDDQYSTAIDWASKLNHILWTREVMNNLYNVHNSELLKNNNDFTIVLIKDLLRSRLSNKSFKNEVINILKSLDWIELLEVRLIVKGKFS